MLPMSAELFYFVSFKPMWLTEFLTPEGSIWGYIIPISWVGPGVRDYMLIEHSMCEWPNVLFVIAMINSGRVGLRRIGIDRFTLDIIEFELLVSVFLRNELSWAYDMFRFGLIFLQSFKGIILISCFVINIRKMGRVVAKTLMPSQKWIIKSHASCNTVKELPDRPSSIVDGLIEVLFHALVEAWWIISRAETFIDSVPVHSPHVCNSLFYLIFIGQFGQICWSYQPEEHVVNSQLEECYIMRITMNKKWIMNNHLATYEISSRV